jgi:hypothetical protein
MNVHNQVFQRICLYMTVYDGTQMKNHFFKFTYKFLTCLGPRTIISYMYYLLSYYKQNALALIIIISFHWNVENAMIPCLFSATLLHQILFHPPSLHLVICFLVFLIILLFPNSCTILSRV